MAVGPINSGAPNMLPPANNSAMKPANPQDAGKLQDALKGPAADENRIIESAAKARRARTARERRQAEPGRPDGHAEPQV